MRTYHECLPCFVNQALGSLNNCSATESRISEAMRRVFGQLAVVDYAQPPPVTARMINRIVAETLGGRDPYVHQKRHFNEFAEKVLVDMKKKITGEPDTLTFKVKLAIAANIIDFGKNVNLSEDEVLANFERAMHFTIDAAAVARLKEAAFGADSILFLCDNAGEIVFDRFLIEDLPYRKITCAVRGMPVINDATMDDAVKVGLADLVKVIPNGSDIPGTLPQECSSEFRKHFDGADLVIAKGQGNFETLSGITGKRIFYLLQVKCPVAARDIGISVGSLAIVENTPAA